MDAWQPDIAGRKGPKYLAIADAIGDALRAGRLAPGARMPTHRALARELKLTVGTITRAYAEAERRGLVTGEVGRGTFAADGAAADQAGANTDDTNAVEAGRDGDRGGDVAGPRTPAPRTEPRPQPRPKPQPRPEPRPESHSAPAPLPEPGGLGLTWPKEPPTADADPIDLASPGAVGGFAAVDLAEAVRAALAPERLRGLFAHGRPEPEPRWAEAGRAWFRETLGRGAGDRFVRWTGGAEHTLSALLAASRARETGVLVEALTAESVKRAIAGLGMRAHPVQMDGEGIMPESLELACWTSGAHLLVCTPRAQDPTAASMSGARRVEIASVADRYGLTIVELAGAGALADGKPLSFLAAAPERTIHVADLSEILAPWLPVGLVACAPDAHDALLAGLGPVGADPAPLMAELAAAWIEDGTAQSLLSLQRTEALQRRRHAIAWCRRLGIEARFEALHGWMTLPDAMRGHPNPAETARRAGVLVAPAARFEMRAGRPPAALRLHLGACGPPRRLSEGLARLGEALGVARAGGA